jgi:hypothetical protein
MRRRSAAIDEREFEAGWERWTLLMRDRYVGALPGLLVQGLRKVGVSNPLILRERHSTNHGSAADNASQWMS